MKNPEYKASLTAEKGGKQLINVVSSTAFAGVIVLILKEFFDKDFKITDVKTFIDDFSGVMIFIVPVISAGIRMLINFKNNYFNKK